MNTIYKKITNTYCYLALAFFLFGFTVDQNKFSNSTTILLSIILLIIIIFFNNIAKKLNSEVMEYITIINLIFCIPRLLFYLYIPEYVNLPFETSLQNLNKGLLLYVSAILLIYAGCSFSNLNNIKNINKNNIINIEKYNQNKLTLSILICGILIFLIDAILNQYFNLSPYIYNTKHEFNNLIQLIKLVISYDTFILLIIFIYINTDSNISKTNNIKFTIIIIILILIFNIYCIYNGVRGAGARIVLEIIAAILVLMNIKKLLIKNIILLIFITIVINIISFPIANSIRNEISSKQNLLTEIGISGVKKEYEKNEKYNSLQLLINRIGIIDYALILPFGIKDEDNFNRIFNIEYLIKSTINTFTPGAYFKESELITSRAMGVIYRNHSYDWPLRNGYFTEYWVLSAILYLYFGFFCIPIYFIIGYVMQTFYNKIKFNSTKNKIYFQMLFIFLIPFNLIFNMGFEHLLLTITVVTFQFLICLFLVTLFYNILNRKI